MGAFWLIPALAAAFLFGALLGCLMRVPKAPVVMTKYIDLPCQKRHVNDLRATTMSDVGFGAFAMQGLPNIDPPGRTAFGRGKR